MSLNEVISTLLLWVPMLISTHILSEKIIEWRKRQKRVRFDRCEICDKPRKLKKTHDEQKNACAKCRKLYNAALVQEVKQESVEG